MATNIIVREMHGNIPYVMEVYSFPTRTEALLFAQEFYLALPDGRWFEIEAA